MDAKEQAVVELRPYQLEAVSALYEAIKRSNNALCVLPTAAGKTEITIEFLKHCLSKYPQLRAVVMLNNIELLRQTVSRYEPFFSVGVYCGTEDRYETDKQITVASIQSIYDVPLDKINVLVIDEAHNIDHTEGRYFEFIKRCREMNERFKIVGFTATPYRADGIIYGPDKLFDSISYKKSPSWMIDNGYLCKPTMRRPNEQFDINSLRVRNGEYAPEDVEKLTGDKAKVMRQVIDALPRMHGRKKAVWACSSINHATLVLECLKELGEDAVTLHSKQSWEDRESNKEAFEQGSARHLTFVSVVKEGYSYSPIDCICLMRPIRSATLYVQIVGRGLRLFPGKEDCLVLDYGRVVETLGSIDDPLIPTQGKKTKGKLESRMKFCKFCLLYIPIQAQVCPECDAQLVEERPVTKNLTKQAAQELSLLGKRKLPEFWTEVRDCYADIYTSKSGNKCWRVTYLTQSISQPYVREFFVLKNFRAQRDGVKLANSLGIGQESHTLEERVGKALRKPHSIKIQVDKFPKVIETKFDDTREGNRESDY